MKIITSKQKALEAYDKWKFAYKNYSFLNEDKADIENKLSKLGKNATPEKVNQIIGNKSWTSVYCDECKKHVEEVIQLGDNPDYESNTAYICLPCLKKAYDKLSKNINKE